MTVIVAPAAGDPDAELDAEPDGAFVPVWEHAVATSKATKATMAARADRDIPYPQCGRCRPEPPRIPLTCASGVLAASAASPARRA